MAWNPSPTVAAARDFGRKFKKQQVIILSLDLVNNSLQMDSYGETKALCDDAREIGDWAYESVMRLMRQRALTEPS